MTSAAAGCTCITCGWPDSAFSRLRGGIAASTPRASRSRATKKANRRIRYGTTAAEERKRERERERGRCTSERIAGRCALQREILEFASRALRASFLALLEYARGKRERERDRTRRAGLGEGERRSVQPCEARSSSDMLLGSFVCRTSTRAIRACGSNSRLQIGSVKFPRFTRGVPFSAVFVLFRR